MFLNGCRYVLEVARRSSGSLRVGESAGRLARIARFPAVLALMVAGVVMMPAASQAATYQLRPNKTLFGSGWTSTPVSSSPDSLLAKPVTQPSTPDTSSYITAASSQDPDGNSVGLQVAAPPALASGESVTGATAWVYLATGAAQTLNLYL
ncbi:MAG TPA: hypothetical protein VGY97_09050, partial [Solirubrobacteraceae bacterium]|nr:hypothetical protein [Solirubrobacteraceae bacterium]